MSETAEFGKTTQGILGVNISNQKAPLLMHVYTQNTMYIYLNTLKFIWKYMY
jgi:hypothetical protein